MATEHGAGDPPVEPPPVEPPPVERPVEAPRAAGGSAGAALWPGRLGRAAWLTAGREWHRLEDGQVPGWLRPHRGEHRLPVMLAIAGAVVMQLKLPSRFAVHPLWLLPGLEIALSVGLTIANPVRIGPAHPMLRLGSLLLIASLTVANGISAVLLIHHLLTGRPLPASELFSAGAQIYLTNIIAFALWYWELDRGGPPARAAGRRAHPDFLFPQMTATKVAPKDWRPTFLDYFYVSFTNATAFSPTDTMPLSRWAKMLMTAQSAVSLAVVGLVIARAVNVL